MPDIPKKKEEEKKFEVKVPTVKQLVEEGTFLNKWTNKDIDRNEKNHKILVRKKQKEKFIRQMKEKSM